MEIKRLKSPTFFRTGSKMNMCGNKVFVVNETLLVRPWRCFFGSPQKLFCQHYLAISQRGRSATALCNEEEMEQEDIGNYVSERISYKFLISDFRRDSDLGEPI